MTRCDWVTDDPLYIQYHDTEWGRPVYDGRHLFECLCLEGFQAGLSWIVILRKRDGFRAAFAQFDPDVLATWGDDHVEHLVQNPQIVRHRGKISAVINNARAWQEIERTRGFANFIWSHVDHQPVVNHWQSVRDVPGQTDLSRTLAKALKQNGFKFCGPTTVYAFMQATGLVSDHVIGCPNHPDNHFTP